MRDQHARDEINKKNNHDCDFRRMQGENEKGKNGAQYYGVVFWGRGKCPESEK